MQGDFAPGRAKRTSSGFENVVWTRKRSSFFDLRDVGSLVPWPFGSITQVAPTVVHKWKPETRSLPDKTAGIEESLPLPFQGFSETEAFVNDKASRLALTLLEDDPKSHMKRS